MSDWWLLLVCWHDGSYRPSVPTLDSLKSMFEAGTLKTHVEHVYVTVVTVFPSFHRVPR